MTDTPIIDAAVVAGRTTAHWYSADDQEDMFRRIIQAALRASLPWDPPDEVIEAMARALCDHRGYTRITEAEHDHALIQYRASPIMRELYPKRL